MLPSLQKFALGSRAYGRKPHIVWRGPIPFRSRRWALRRWPSALLTRPLFIQFIWVVHGKKEFHRAIRLPFAPPPFWYENAITRIHLDDCSIGRGIPFSTFDNKDKFVNGVRLIDIAHSFRSPGQT